jgi:hypothetical protein
LDLSVWNLGNDTASWCWGRGWNLNLSVGDLGDWGSSRGWDLDLSIRDLRDWSGGRGWDLDLSVGDLGDWGRWSSNGGWCLDLSVRDLGDWGSSGGWCLDLSIGDLGDRSNGRGYLWLSITDLGDWCGSSGRGLRLAITDLGSNTSGGRARAGSTAWENVQVDWVALSGPMSVVKVVETTTVALVEDGRSTESQGTVATRRPSSSVDSTSLGWLVELVLVVGGNVSGTTFGIGQDTVGEIDGESTLSTA